MSSPVFWCVFGAALALGLAFRLADPAVRPMHHDEANQAVRFGMLLETGEYRYDRHDHHGPTLYYLTLPFAWLRGQRTLAALDEGTLRMVPAVFGAGLLLLFLPLSPGPGIAAGGRGIGRVAVASAAALAAVSPVLTYYNRFYIQESIFVFFALAFAMALGRYALRPRPGTAIWVGALAGLAYATKETSLIVLPATVAACALAALIARSDDELPNGAARPRAGPRRLALHALAAIAAALVPSFILYSAFFSNPAGLLDSFSAFSVYLWRGLEPERHAHPWFFYLQTLAWTSSGGLVWTEGLVLVLAAIGIVHAVAARRTAFWPLYIAVQAVITAVIFSAIRYKTPWNVMPFYVGFVLLAGVGVAALLARARHRLARIVVLMVIVAAGWHLAGQSLRASFRYGADPRNPYVYAHTSSDFVRLSTRVHDLAAVHPEGRDLLVKVVAGPYEQWPFPWYARDLGRVGYWAQPGEAGALDDAAVIVASQEHVEAVDAVLGERYVAEFYGLRPGVLLALYVERGLWDRYMESRQ